GWSKPPWARTAGSIPTHVRRTSCCLHGGQRDIGMWRGGGVVVGGPRRSSRVGHAPATAGRPALYPGRCAGLGAVARAGKRAEFAPRPAPAPVPPGAAAGA